VLVAEVAGKFAGFAAGWIVEEENLADTAGVSVGLATFRRKKPFLDDRATDLGARTRRRPAAGRGTAASDTLIQPRIS
jgi:hypothetical protein